MNALSLFSGIGGLDLAAEWAGFKTVAFCEQDKFCQKVLRKHWPDVRIYDDVRTLETRWLPRIELLHGGYPCQPFSAAGNRKGETDKRHLWPHMFRLIKELKPRWIVAENVSGHISLGLDTVCNDLESESYAVGTVCFPACAIGARHKRERVFIVANAERDGLNEAKELGGIAESLEKRRLLEFERFSDTPASLWTDGNTKAAGRGVFTPYLCRSDDGISNRVDRIKSLGNAVVPQQAYPIFAAIAETYNALLRRGGT